MNYSNVSIMFVVIGFVGIGVTAYNQTLGYGQTSLYLTALASVLAFVVALVYLSYHVHLEGKKGNEKE